MCLCNCHAAVWACLTNLSLLGCEKLCAVIGTWLKGWLRKKHKIWTKIANDTFEMEKKWKKNLIKIAKCMKKICTKKGGWIQTCGFTVPPIPVLLFLLLFFAQTMGFLHCWNMFPKYMQPPAWIYNSSLVTTYKELCTRCYLVISSSNMVQ